jgi:hypothetical protein
MHLTHVAQHDRDGVTHTIDTGTSHLHLAGRDGAITALLLVRPLLSSQPFH